MEPTDAHAALQPATHDASSLCILGEGGPANNAVQIRPRPSTCSSARAGPLAQQFLAGCPTCGRPFFDDRAYSASTKLLRGGARDSPLRISFETEVGLSDSSFNQGYYARFFREGKRLGHGLRGTVFICQHVLDDVELGMYAVKKIPIGNNHRWLVAMLNEVNALERLCHPNIVSYKHTWIEYHQVSDFGPEVPSLFMLMELATGGSIEDWLVKVNSNQNREAKGKEPAPRLDSRFFEVASRIMIEFATGLVYVHSCGIVHRDLKPSNLLLLDGSSWLHPGRLVISDFGECCSSSNFGAASDAFKEVSPEYAAPEVIASFPIEINASSSRAYMEAGDIWSAGVIIFELVTGQSFNLVQWAKHPRPPNAISSIYWGAISQCLSLDPMDRPCATELLAQLIAARGDGVLLRKGSPPLPIRGLLEYNKKPLLSSRGLSLGFFGALALGSAAVALALVYNYML
ncbi:putative serine/threonine-protein kinase iks1 [Mitosporidium daphniae]